MGVYIKNMSLVAFKKIMELGLEVNDDLLVEVTEPHGRLIDADVCKQRVYDGSRTPYKVCPTVIEAEGE